MQQCGNWPNNRDTYDVFTIHHDNFTTRYNLTVGVRSVPDDTIVQWPAPAAMARTGTYFLGCEQVLRLEKRQSDQGLRGGITAVAGDC